MSTAHHSVIASAHANIAFAKYWGKKRGDGNLPATDSVGVCLEALASTTLVRPLSAEETRTRGYNDRFILDGVEQTGKALERTRQFLDLVRKLAGVKEHFEVIAKNTFPTAAGLASSASGFAALTLAATTAAGLRLEPHELSALARQGSGSAARSIPPGYSRMLSTRKDPCAVTIAPRDHLPIEFAIVILHSHEKETSSRDGMSHCTNTSSYHEAWVHRAQEDAQNIADAIVRKDLQALGEMAEANALAMHADCMAARPPLVYFSSQTFKALEKAQALRKKGHQVFFTCDAGPHPILFYHEKSAGAVKELVGTLGEVERVVYTKPCGGADLLAG